MAKCMFCNQDLCKGNSSVEHIFRKSWLSRLGHSKTNVGFVAMSGAVVVEERDFVATSHVVGSVCNKCNNGWMNDLDLLVEPTLFAMIESKKFQMSKEEAQNICRWILKVACCHENAGPVKHDKTPLNIRKNLKNKGYIQKGIILFYAYSSNNVRNVACSHMDIWPLPESKKLITYGQEYRQKFAIQYDRLLIGFARVGISRPIFLLNPKIHTVLYVSDADFVFWPDGHIMVYPDKSDYFREFISSVGAII